MNARPPFELEMTRVIRAPRERVFDAFVNADLLGAWHCPRGMACRSATTDARVGGRFRIVMAARDGSTFTVGGEYRELVRPERLQFTWRWENEAMPQGETLVTVTLSPHAEGTHLHLHHSGFLDAADRDSHGQGWDSTFGRLCDQVDPRGTAASLTLLGDPRSTYVRTARMGFAEKGVAITLVPASPRSAEIAGLHPFTRIPVLRDGELVLFETSAILRYAEEAFDGPSLLPRTVRGRAECEQWVSAINCYLYDAAIRRCVLAYLFAGDGGPDRTVIDPALSQIREHLAVFDRAFSRSDYLAGGALSMADLLLAPILAYLERVPEGPALFAAVPNVARAQATIRARPSFAATDPTPAP